jgi:predicted NAD/FAD-dependent oxidoreductase
MKDFCIVGAGIAGSTIANLLSKKYSVEIFEKGKGPGGRSSKRRYEKDINFDHGLQYISPKDKSFTFFIKSLYKKKILSIWKGNHIDFTSNNKKQTKYIGKKGNNDICKYLLKNIKTNYSVSIKSISFKSDHWEIRTLNNSKFFFKNLILTCPFPQVKILAKKYVRNSFFKSKIKMQPNITIMAIYKGVKPISISSIKFKDKIISWAANENSKNRFKSNLCIWTLQASLKWSKIYINKYKNMRKDLTKNFLNHFSKLVGFNQNKIIFSDIHGWKYSYNLNQTRLKSMWIYKYNLGICGDWFIGPKGECAWLSAKDLYKKYKKKPA